MSEVLDDLIQTFMDNGLSLSEAEALAEKAAKDFEFAKKNISGTITITTETRSFSGSFATFLGVDSMPEMSDIAAFLNRETGEAVDLLAYNGRNQNGPLTPEDMWYENWLRVEDDNSQITFTGPEQSVVWDPAKKRWFVVDNEV